ncbi:hypothetical protein CFP56_006012 [Quercus suber]|uniref:Uncharacterized protein n=1 Tax=Quercus suber TaxID=58331 RepID=A0AAW0M8D9_QUESU
MLLAADYKNETEVVGAFQSGLVKREDLFITTKVLLKILDLEEPISKMKIIHVASTKRKDLLSVELTN